MSTIETLKAEGNAAFAAGKWGDAIAAYTKAIEQASASPVDSTAEASKERDTKNGLHILYSNRSAAFLGAQQPLLALADANSCIRQAPADFWKGHLRKAAACISLGQYTEALAACVVGLKIDADNKSLRDTMASAQEMIAASRRKADEKLRAAEERREEERRGEAPTGEEGRGEEGRGEGRGEDLLADFFAEVDAASAHPDGASVSLSAGSAGIKRRRREAYEGEEEETPLPPADEPDEPMLDPAATAKQTVALAAANLGSGDSQIFRLVKHKFAKFLNLNPYEILQLPHTATLEDIKARYRKLSALVHPDKNLSNPDARAAFDLVHKALETLESPDRRKLIVATMAEAVKLAKRKRRQKINSGAKEASLPPLDEDIAREVRRAFAEQQQRKKTYETRIKEEAKKEVDDEVQAMEEEASERREFAEWAKGYGDRAEKWQSFQVKRPRVGDGIKMNDALRYGAKHKPGSSDDYKSHWR